MSATLNSQTTEMHRQQKLERFLKLMEQERADLSREKRAAKLLREHSMTPTKVTKSARVRSLSLGKRVSLFGVLSGLKAQRT